MSPNSTFRDLLKAFNDCDVRYLVVGGYAVMLYTEPRFTKDLDVWVEPTPENAQKVFRALAAFGAPLSRIRPEDFATEGMYYQIGVAPVRVDILMSLDGVSFDAAWMNRREAPFGEEPAHFIGREELIRNKTAVGRALDLIDAERLKQA